MSKRRNRLGIILLSLILMLTFMLPAFANTLQDKRQELDGVRDQQKAAEQELKQSKKEEKNLQQELRSLENVISKAQAEIRSLNRKINDTENKITVAEAELQEAEEQIADMEELLGIRLRAIYENGQVSFLEVLLSSTSFRDFLTRYNNLQLIIAQDRELLQEYEGERERIVAMKGALEERRQELESLRRDNLTKKQDLEQKTRERERVLVAVRKEIDRQEEAIRKLEAEAKKIEQLIRQLQQQQKSGTYLGTGKYLWPVPEFGPSWITSGYGFRRHPITRKPGSFHGGVDIGVPNNRWPGSRYYTGSPVHVVAADSGIAYTYRMGSGYGNLVIIDHGAGYATVYAHNHDFLVANGQSVVRGDAIAIVGSTGFSTGPHLHFEIRINGERVDPLPHIK